MPSGLNKVKKLHQNRTGTPSDLLSELHVYIVPLDKWIPFRRLAKNHIVDETVSAGFVRVPPIATLSELRVLLHQQLDFDVPEHYVFIKSVGRNFTQVKSHQENTVKVKNFLPPQAPEPEIHVLEISEDLINRSGSIPNLLLSDTEFSDQGISTSRLSHRGELAHEALSLLDGQDDIRRKKSSSLYSAKYLSVTDQDAAATSEGNQLTLDEYLKKQKLKSSKADSGQSNDAKAKNLDDLNLKHESEANDNSRKKSKNTKAQRNSNHKPDLLVIETEVPDVANNSQTILNGEESGITLDYKQDNHRKVSTSLNKSYRSKGNKSNGTVSDENHNHTEDQNDSQKQNIKRPSRPSRSLTKKVSTNSQKTSDLYKTNEDLEEDEESRDTFSASAYRAGLHKAASLESLHKITSKELFNEDLSSTANNTSNRSRKITRHNRGNRSLSVSGVDRRSVSGVDRSVSRVDRSVSRVDRSVSGLDKSVSGVDRSVSGVDRRKTSLDGSQSHQKKSTTKDNYAPHKWFEKRIAKRQERLLEAEYEIAREALKGEEAKKFEAQMKKEEELDRLHGKPKRKNKNTTEILNLEGENSFVKDPNIKIINPKSTRNFSVSDKKGLNQKIKHVEDLRSSGDGDVSEGVNPEGVNQRQETDEEKQRTREENKKKSVGKEDFEQPKEDKKKKEILLSKHQTFPGKKHFSLYGRKDLEANLHKVIHEKGAYEDQRTKLFSKARSLHEQILKVKENHRQKWWEEYNIARRKGTKLEDRQANLRQELEGLYRKAIGSLLKREPLITGVKGGPSKHASYKISVIRLRHEIADLVKRVEAIDIKLQAETRLRQQAEHEVKSLRSEVSRKKASVALTQSKTPLLRNGADDVII